MKISDCIFYQLISSLTVDIAQILLFVDLWKKLKMNLPVLQYLIQTFLLVSREQLLAPSTHRIFQFFSHIHFKIFSLQLLY